MNRKLYIPGVQVHRDVTALARSQGAKSIVIPIPTTPWPVLTVAVPMTEENWGQMIDMLNLMKSVIVAEEQGE